MSSTATLEYSVTAQGPITPTQIESALSGVLINYLPIEEITGAALSSDVTTLAGSVASRTIVFNITGVHFQTRFPPGTDQAAPFRGLYLQTLAGTLGAVVTEHPVVIA